jgi:hypothetical protein
MVMRRRTFAGVTGVTGVTALAAVLALAACGGDDTGSGATSGTVPSVSDTTPGSSVPPSSAPPSTPPLSVTSMPPQSSPRSLPGTPMDPTLPLVTDAVADLANHLDISPDEITVVAAREVTWPDGSLGCPQPGMMYTQALQDGALVVLEVNGQRYEYHGGTPLVLCENPKPPIGG